MKQSFSFYRLVHFTEIATLTSLLLVALILFTLLHPRNTIGSHSCLSFISTCGCQTDERGPNQNVISFSLFGNLSEPSLSVRYVQPLKALTANISRIYPDWIVRIYHNFSKESGEDWLLRKMLDNPANVDLCDSDDVLRFHQIQHNVFPMIWRFLPLLDPLVDRFMSRDTDAELISRETDAVREWLASGATFHAMRDHPWHCSMEMLGGLWGAKVQQRRDDISRAIVKLFNRRMPFFHGVDQLLLKFYLWPLAIKDSVIHDSHCCELFPSSRPFPSKRQESSLFVGSVYSNQSVPSPGICPIKCRPEGHPDWTEC
ncbi:uncharacterized protein LOC130698156 [Daphnia carinata]|uniref:uncharacterized protein LOC130698156 n=1 Tax=Daphnia carinata TaxID=120202 RepID=UPI00286890E9|nr:uncharacterized protein LOC130698156 [Daphnia carinata]